MENVTCSIQSKGFFSLKVCVNSFNSKCIQHKKENWYNKLLYRVQIIVQICNSS